MSKEKPLTKEDIHQTEYLSRNCKKSDEDIDVIMLERVLSALTLAKKGIKRIDKEYSYHTRFKGISEQCLRTINILDECFQIQGQGNAKEKQKKSKRENDLE